jgi:D-arabinose 1-dehydrogenase-like Zn-dependent alcohol dehydrogenase
LFAGSKEVTKEGSKIYDRMVRGDVRYRFVIDIASLRK